MRVRGLTETRPIVLTLAFVAAAAAFGQFGAVSALGDVAHAFGAPASTNSTSFTAEAGLSGSTIAIGLAVLRLASLGALPLASLADRRGRRRVLFACGTAGLCVTAAAALSPSYWWFVAIFALARPALSAANTLASVMTAELTSARTRVTALAVVAAGAGAGAGTSAILHGLFRGPNGFRVLFATALVPAAILAVLVPRLPETRAVARRSAHAARLGAIPHELRGRLAIVMGITAAVGAITGPANGFAFVYGENILKLRPGFVSAVVALSAITGLLGLVIGRRLADHRGRRRAVVIGVLATAATSLFAYSGGRPAFVAGYLVGVCAAAMLAPSGAALTNETFPGVVRASAGGWAVVAGVLGAVAGLAVFGSVADATNSTGLAAAAAFLPGLPVLFLVRRLPETRGLALS
jgi:MFS family permease